MYTYRIIFSNTGTEEGEGRGIDLIVIDARAGYTVQNVFYPNSFYFGNGKVLPILFGNSIEKKCTV